MNKEELKAEINRNAKRILKEQKPKTTEILEEIKKNLIEGFDQLSLLLRRNWNDKNKDEQIADSALFFGARDRVSAALQALAAHCNFLLRHGGNAEKLRPLAVHIEVPDRIGSTVEVSKAPEVDFSDPEADESEDPVDLLNEEEEEEEEEEYLENEMATFDIKTAVALVPCYDGSTTTLDQFTSSVELLNTLTSDNHTATLLAFVKTRLVGKARDVAAAETSVLAIVERLKATCATSENSQSVAAKLAAVKQRTSASGFAEEVKKLTEELSNMYVKEGVSTQAASQLANTAGVSAMINGCKSPQTKFLLRAGNLKTVQEASTKIILEDQNSTEVARVLQMATRGGSSNSSNGGRGGRNFRGNGGRGSNNNNSYRSNNNNDGNRGRNYRGRQNNSRNNNYSGSSSNNSNGNRIRVADVVPENGNGPFEGAQQQRQQQ